MIENYFKSAWRNIRKNKNIFIDKHWETINWDGCMFSDIAICKLSIKL